MVLFSRGLNVTKEEFLSNPLAYYFGAKLPTENVPIEWFREAWDTNSTFREEMIYYFADNVKKSGSIRFPINVGEMSDYFSAEQAIQLYEGLRDGADRCETEWRIEFQEDFPQCVDRLPPINRVRVCDCLTRSVIFAMRYRKYPYLQRMLSEFKLWGISLNEARLPVGEIMADFKCLADAVDDATFSVFQIAKAEGMAEVAAMLREAGASE
jgi:hypothetical protein